MVQHVHISVSNIFIKNIHYGSLLVRHYKYTVELPTRYLFFTSPKVQTLPRPTYPDRTSTL